MWPTDSDKCSGSGNVMCKLHDSVNCYALDIDEELGLEVTFSFVGCFLFVRHG